MREIGLILQRISLRQHAAIRVAQQADAAQLESLPHGFGVLHRVFDGVAGRVVQLLRFPRPPLIDEDQLVVAREG